LKSGVIFTVADLVETDGQLREYVVRVVTVSELELDEESPVFHDTPFLVMVQPLVSVMVQLTVTEDPFETRDFDTLIEEVGLRTAMGA